MSCGVHDPFDDEWIPQTPLEWFGWLSSEEQKTRQSYLAKPSNLIADYRREKQITRDYEGREILELLQNSADQTLDDDVKVVIELQPEGMIVANTGAPFSEKSYVHIRPTYMMLDRRSEKMQLGSFFCRTLLILAWGILPK